MKTLIGLLLSVLLYPSTLKAEEVGMTPYIVGGSDAYVSNYPFMALLMFEYESQPNTIYPFCGGSVLDATHILTAAHCVYDISALNISNTKVAIDANNSTEVFAVQRVTVKNIYYPSNYNDSTLVNDVAVLELSEPLPTYASVKKVSLSSSDDQIFYRDESQDFTIVGYGRLGSSTDGKNQTLQFMEASVNYVSTANCGLWQGINITDKLICTKGNAKPGLDADLVTGACQGDSGGPLIWNNKQIGIVSFGPATCGQESADAQSVFTDVSQYKDWILQAQRGEFAPTTSATPNSGSSGGALTFGGLLALYIFGFSRRKLS